MAKITRSKEIWHIPKRGSVHQTIFMVYVLSWDKFLGKTWSSGKQESIGSEMGKVGLTQSGKAITHQSVRTLLANLPKYLGFVYLDEPEISSSIRVTDIGNELIRYHQIQKVPKHKNLGEYEEAKDLVKFSNVFKEQMLKLIITNPSIKKDCENILVFPFRMTLKLLLELGYLDKEEIGYILFHTKKEDEISLLIEKIRKFRSLPPGKRDAEINVYKKTEEGKLTLVKAPTSGYYMALCYSTGLCDKFSVKVNKLENEKLPAIKLRNEQDTKKELKRFEDVEVYDFKDNWGLWKEYFTNPKRIHPPFDKIIKISSKEEMLIILKNGKYVVKSGVISKEKPNFAVPVFENEVYEVILYKLYKSGRKIYDKNITFSKSNREFLINLRESEDVQIITEENTVEKIRQMFSEESHGFDDDYFTKLETIESVVGKNYIDNRRRGGRLEGLFAELFSLLKDKAIIDKVTWYGKVSEEHGISEPAPGGKEGNPDIVFEIDDYLFVLELTTIKGYRAQWNSSEASSVPDHITKFKNNNPDKKVIGIFSAPSIHPQLEENLKLNARNEQVGMIFKTCIDFAELLSKMNRKTLKENLIQESNKQLNK